MNTRIVPLVGLTLILAIIAVVVISRFGPGSEPAPERSTEAAAPAVASVPAGANPESTPSDRPASEPTTTTSSIQPVPDLGAAPDLVGIDGWLQSEVTSLDELRGQVVVVHFWTFGCINCKHTLPYLQDLAAHHADDPFTIVGVHSPEFTYEEDPVAIEEAAEMLGVTWPIALDTNQKSFFGWQGSPAYWPRTYVIDQEGNVRFDHIGEGAYDELADVVAELLDGS